MVMNSRLALPLDHRVVDDLAGGEARGGHVNAVFFLAGGALPVLGEGGGAHRLERGEACPLDRAHHAGAVFHVERGVDRDPDETHADHAGKTGARKPFQPAACPIGAGFAKIDRRQLALGPWHLAEKDGWESGRAGRHEGLAKLTTRKATAASKQSAFPPSIGRRPHACSRARSSSRPGGQHRSGCCPSSEAGLIADGGGFPHEALEPATCAAIYGSVKGAVDRFLGGSGLPHSAGSQKPYLSPVWLPRR